LPVNLAEQLLPGTFEYALNHLVDSGAVALSAFDAHYANDDVGAPAVLPEVLLKVVLLGYSSGLVSSRAIASACERPIRWGTQAGLCSTGKHSVYDKNLLLSNQSIQDSFELNG
jgi:transposase